ncbi:CinA family protein [Ruania alba]|uniref:Competence/damage-inducible protein cinA n=1 Tax=Ruania alba TaxID=648782 RepID=A0A1H5E593_9MICO|nr:nicotinamide-nucleotide amidohydrolase family protein [Ruania alba]SED86262.1 competence/damage-inducible protein cinA [Ruania alba]
MTAARVIARARALGRTVAVAESLTAGAVAARLAEPPGASDALLGAVVAYATRVKRELLGVDGELLATHGPVHPEVAWQMADGVRRLLGSDVGVATTGVAGPGPADGHPAGTVYVAAVAGGQNGVPVRGQVRGYRLAGTRPLVRTATCGLALAALVAVLESDRDV